jgi:hypothetical protein
MSLWTNVDNTAGKPKNLKGTEKDSVYGVSLSEAQVASNRAKGIKTPGWVKYTTYTDAQGHTRNKSEVLVALNNMTSDANDDAVVADA